MKLISKQEAFDTAVRGIHAQGGPAMDGHRCMYRAPDGKKCAFGLLIPDELYDPKMDLDSQAASKVLSLFPHVRALFTRTKPKAQSYDPTEVFFTALQSCHDNAAREELYGVARDGGNAPSFAVGFAKYLRHFAARYDLNPAVIDECYPTK